MRLIRRPADWPASPDGSVVTIGNLDGLHLGHRAMLGALGERAALLGVPATVVSFEPLPREHFAGDAAPARLQGLRDRVASLAGAGVERLLLLRFDAARAAQTAEGFVDEIIVRTCRARHVIVGDDFRFGRARAGDAVLLERIGREEGFTVSACATVGDGAGRISSSRIRAHLAAGELDAAAALLGRPYRISGRVVRGERLGRRLGFPTANIRLGRNHRPPARGVFAVRAVELGSGSAHAGVANLGERPTVDGTRLLLEVHLFDVSPDLYGRHLAVDFHRRLREERRFGSLEELRAQIGRDAAAAREALEAIGGPA